MLPSQVAGQIRRSIVDYLQTTFAFTRPELRDGLEHFLIDPERGLFKGPFVSVRLPYRKAPENQQLPLDVAPPFVPFVHQHRAFERLTSRGPDTPRHTLVTTGTGSGKTECFLYPVLDHCVRMKGRPGIKAIVLYPMNALATDQARRIADILSEDERVKGNVRVGLYIGGSQEDCDTPGKEERKLGTVVITDREALRSEPPDILLTNYRMLDYLLLRPQDGVLWKDNAPDTLRYLVLDELHTYDGAQGSDVSCLIRRLRARLGVKPGESGFTCVGTSATVVAAGDDADGGSDAKLLDFASLVFGTQLPKDAIIKEERERLNAYLQSPRDFAYPPYPMDFAALQHQTGEALEAYCERQAALWLGSEGATDPITAGEALRGHPLLLMVLLAAQRSVRAQSELCAQLARDDLDFERLAGEVRTAALESFLSVVSWARRMEGKRAIPLLTVHVHLWTRELRRLLREVHPRDVVFRWPEDQFPEGTCALPTYYCRECGHAGWVSLQHQGDAHLNRNPREILRAYFERSQWLRYVALADDALESEEPPRWLDPSSLQLRSLRDGPPPQGGFKVQLHHHTGSSGRDQQRCPACDTDRALILVGAQGATLNSVSVSQFFTSRLSAEKKLLAFTDSVQDASHQAGFLTGRTYRFSLRSAFLQALPEDEDVSLAEVGPRAVAALDARLGLADATATLFAPERREEPDYRAFMETPGQRRPAALEATVQLRASVEAVLELGYNARLGRSLYKVGSAALRFDSKALEAAARHLAYLAPNEFPGLFTGCDDKLAALHRLMLSLLHRVATRGGIHHPLFDPFLKDGGNDWLLRGRAGTDLPRLPLYERPLRFVTRQKRKRTLDHWESSEPRRTWVYDFVLRALVDGGRPLEEALSHDTLSEELDLLQKLLGAVLDALTLHGLLRDYGNESGQCLGIPQTACWVSRRVRLLRCGTCGHLMTLATEEAEVLEAGRCLGYRCVGQYGPDPRPEQRYYREVYARSDIRRVFAEEHTGLLTRSEREAVEEGFKGGVPADAPNLLSATPTLEMGIDVGDLSGTLMAGVPPTVANFVQRAGRAGRKTGNALLLTLARATPHDLYFFEKPVDMIAGAVTAPGTFLDAPEMLIRQLNAFCLDQWVRDAKEKAVIPGRVKDLLSAELGGRFPGKFLAWVDANRPALLETFFGLFGDAMSQENRERLADASRELEARLAERLRHTRESIEELQRLRKRLKEREIVLKERPDPALNQEQRVQDLQDLATDLRAVEGRLLALNNQWGLDYLVSNGFLPNYALAEPAVTLSYVITGVPDAGMGTGRERGELERPAARALRELAPFNTFYAKGRKLLVDQVRAGTRDHSRIERWAFCSRCSHTELWRADLQPHPCTSCGTDGFGQQGQVREVLRLQEVAARQPHHSSLSLDDSDERSRERYLTQALFEPDPGTKRRAWADPERVFGYEWLAKVHLRELNLGLEREDGAALELHDEQVKAPGFSICDDCGIVRNRLDTKKKPFHLFRCRSKTGGEKWREVFLYRQMQSEALRVLLPIVTFDAESRLKHLMASLRLGLREKFGGQPVHLKVDQSSEPTPTPGVRRRFLVLYDNVEGGTGYLREFAQEPAAFLDLFQRAKRLMETCHCTRGGDDEGAAPGDGCYRCLFAGAEGRIDGLSKRAALGVLSLFLTPEPNLVEVETLSNIEVEPAADSELEELFLDAFLGEARKRGFAVERLKVRGLDAHRLTRKDQALNLVQQVDVNREHGVEIASRPDFVLQPLTEADGTQATRLSVAIFCDGYRFHARLEGGDSIVHQDVAKRAALVRSGKYRVWTTTWSDLEGAEGAKATGPVLLESSAARTFAALPLVKSQERDALERRPVAQLLDLATEWPQEAWGRLGAALAIATATPPQRLSESEWLRYCTALEAQGLTAVPSTAAGTWVHGARELRPARLSVGFNAADPSSLMANPSEIVRWVLHLEDDAAGRQDDGYREAWRLYWGLFNWMQVLPQGVLQTTRSLEGGGVDGKLTAFVDAEAPNWVSEVEPSLAALAQALAKAAVPTPELLAELAPPDSRRGAWGQAELSWHERKAAILLPDLADDFDIEAARSAGWTLWIADASLSADAVISFLKEGG